MKKSGFLFSLMTAAGITLASAGTASAQIMVLGGNPAGSLWYAQSQALAATVTKHSGMRVDVLPQSGTVFFPMFGTGEVDMGVASPIEAYFATKAQWPFEGVNNGKGYDMRTVMLGAPNRLSLVTGKDSGVNSLADLKGRRVVTNYGAFAGATLTSLSALANAGLTEDDVRVVRVSSYPEGVRAVIEGRADAAVGSIGSGILQELESARGAKILEIDPSPEAMERVKKVGPAFYALAMNADSVGVEKGTHILAYATTVVARPDLDDARVAKFIEVLWDHYKELPEITRTLAAWTPDRYASASAVIPYHPAAVKFYKDKGVWTDEMEKRQQELMSGR